MPGSGSTWQQGEEGVRMAVGGVSEGGRGRVSYRPVPKSAACRLLGSHGRTLSSLQPWVTSQHPMDVCEQTH